MGYSDLWSDVKRLLARDDLDADIDRFIRQGEARINRELRVRAMENRAQANGNNSRFIRLPTKFLEMRRLWMLTDPIWTLEYTGPDSLGVINDNSDGSYPVYFTVHNEIEFDRPVSDDWVLEMIYYREVEPLSDENQTNPVYEAAPSLYTMAALSESTLLTRDKEAGTIWESSYQDKRRQYVRSDRGGKYSLATMRATSETAAI